jgi:hypothetical protein
MSTHTSKKNRLHRQTAKLAGLLQKSAFWAGIDIFNSVRLASPSLRNKKTQSQGALIKYLNAHSFYSVDTFFVFDDDP